jgi:hypothetical protein
MMKKTICVALFATLLFVGCNGDNDAVAPEQNGTVIRLGLSGTKTSFGEVIDGERVLYWSAGDRIAINGEISGEAQLEGEKSTLATFSFAKELGYPRNILYPASLYNDATSITLTRVQNFAEGTVATNTLPMATMVESGDEPSKLHHLAAVVHVQLKAEAGGDHNNAVRKVEIRGRNNEQMSGAFLIDYNATTLTHTKVYPPVVEGDDKSDLSEKVDDLVTGSRVAGELSAEEVTDVFVVVPAREYERGFTVRVINDQGHYMDKAKPSGVTLHNGEVYKLPVIEYIPTGTLLSVEL